MTEKKYTIQRSCYGITEYLIRDTYYGDSFWKTEKDLCWDLLFNAPGTAKKSLKQLLRWIKMDSNTELILIEFTKKEEGFFISNIMDPVEIPEDKKYQKRVFVPG